MKIVKSILNKNLIICFVIISIFNSCDTNNKSNLTHHKKFYVSDSLIYKYESNELFNGVVVDTVNNQIVTYQVKDGKKNGYFKILSLTGKQIMAGNIVDNKNEGEWTYYYDDGSLESIGFFKNDKPDSLWYWYYPDSTLKEKGYFLQGKRVGDWYSYDKNGKIIKKQAFPDTLAKSQ